MAGDSYQCGAGGQQNYDMKGVADRITLRRAAAVIGIVIILVGLTILAASIHSFYEVLDWNVPYSFRDANIMFSLVAATDGIVHICIGMIVIAYSGGELTSASRSRIIGQVLLLGGIYLAWMGARDLLYMAVYVLNLDMGLQTYTVETLLTGTVWLLGGIVLITLRRGQLVRSPY